MREETSDTVLGTEDGPVPPFLRFSIKKIGYFFYKHKVGKPTSPTNRFHSLIARSAQHFCPCNGKDEDAQHLPWISMGCPASVFKKLSPPLAWSNLHTPRPSLTRNLSRRPLNWALSALSRSPMIRLAIGDSSLNFDVNKLPKIRVYSLL